MFRFVALVLLLLSLSGPPASARAAAPAATPPAPAAAAAPTAEQMEAMVGTLEDPAARAKLVEQLKILVAAQRGTAQAEGEAEEEAPPETLGARALGFLADRVETLSQQLVQAAQAFGDLPRVVDWIKRQIEDPMAHERWVQLAIEATMILISGWVIARFTDFLLLRPRRAIEGRRHATVLGRSTFLLLRALLGLLPIAAFALAGYGILTVSAPGPRVRLVVLALINATIIVQVVLVVANAVFAPTAPGLRLLRIADETAAYGYIWVRRLAGAGIFGYFMAEGAYVLGLPLGAYGAVLKLLGILIAAMLVILVLQNRQSVADWLRGNPLSGHGDPDTTAEREAEGQGAVLRSARRRLADIWHLLAIGYILVAFAEWMLNVYGGFVDLARATGVTLLIVVVARLLVNGINRALSHGFRVSGELRELFPNLEQRANLYVPALHRGVKAVVWLIALLVLLDTWGIDTLEWLETPLGRRVTGSVVTITVIVVLAIVAWEVVSALIERFLAATEHNGTRVERSARVRTLLPLLRNAFLVVLITVVSLITLSELGVNIAPLLAGAGVVGLAVGFGSQTLVKDVITGLFILFEDTISVGDVVDVGGGHSGVVEAISIRTIRLRDTAGAVHSVPFSAVTTVKNMTKDFSFYVFNVSVSYSEDPDRVIQVLNDIGIGMQADTQYAPDILAPLEVMGVDRLADSGIIIMARFKTRPLKQWAVGREFNKRMKNRFGELGISIPYPHMQLVMTASDRSLGEALAQGS